MKKKSLRLAVKRGTSIILSVIAWTLIVFGALGIIGIISSQGFNVFSVVIAAIFFILPGFLLLRKASKTKKTAMMYRKYIDIIANQNIRRIDDIALAVGWPYDIVVLDLQKMINIGYFKDAYINHDTGVISLRQHTPVVSSQHMAHAQTPPQMAYGQMAPQTKAVRCPGCGANNVITVSGVSECEYCGTRINA